MTDGDRAFVRMTGEPPTDAIAVRRVCGSCGYEQELYSETLPQGETFCGNYPICQCPRCGKDAFDAQLFVNGRMAAWKNEVEDGCSVRVSWKSDAG